MDGKIIGGMSQTKKPYYDLQKVWEEEKNVQLYRESWDQCCNNCNMVDSVVVIKGNVIWFMNIILINIIFSRK